MLGTPLTSFVLSQFFGLYLLIVGIIMLSRVNAYRRMAQKMKPQSGTIVLAGLIGLFFGMIFIGIHNIWNVTPMVVVTLICWLVFIVSLLFLATPERMVALIRKLFLSSGYYVLIAVIVILGTTFLVRGVYLYATHHQTFLFLSMN